MEGKIEHSKTSGQYVLKVDGNYVGDYKTMLEAVREYEYIVRCDNAGKEDARE